MAILLKDKPNVIAPGGNYPFGRVKNDTGASDGTPVNEELLGDSMQFFEKLLSQAGITANGVSENSSDGFQYMTALLKLINEILDVIGMGALPISVTSGNILTLGQAGIYSIDSTSVANLPVSTTGLAINIPNRVIVFFSSNAKMYHLIWNGSAWIGWTCLQDLIASEASTRASADTSEATTRAAADTAEATARASADSTEAIARNNADVTLQNNIDSEATARADEDAKRVLSDNIINIQTADLNTLISPIDTVLYYASSFGPSNGWGANFDKNYRFSVFLHSGNRIGQTAIGLDIAKIYSRVSTNGGTTWSAWQTVV